MNDSSGDVPNHQGYHNPLWESLFPSKRATQGFEHCSYGFMTGDDDGYSTHFTKLQFQKALHFKPADFRVSKNETNTFTLVLAFVISVEG